MSFRMICLCAALFAFFAGCVATTRPPQKINFRPALLEKQRQLAPIAQALASQGFSIKMASADAGIINTEWRDFTITQGIILISAATYVVINLIVDILYMIIDPRVKLAK